MAQQGTFYSFGGLPGELHSFSVLLSGWVQQVSGIAHDSTNSHAYYNQSATARDYLHLMHDQNHAHPYDIDKGAAEARKQAVLARAFQVHRERVVQIRAEHALRIEAAHARWDAPRSNPSHPDHDTARTAFDAVKDATPDLKLAGDALAAAIRQIEAEHRGELRRLRDLHGVANGVLAGC